jgi:hypothetical protein
MSDHKTVIAKLRKALAARRRQVNRLADEQERLRVRAAAAGVAARQAEAVSALVGLMSGTSAPSSGVADELRALQTQLGEDGGGGGGGGGGSALEAVPLGWDPRAAAANAADYDVSTADGIRRIYASFLIDGLPLVK